MKQIRRAEMENERSEERDNHNDNDNDAKKFTEETKGSKTKAVRSRLSWKRAFWSRDVRLRWPSNFWRSVPMWLRCRKPGPACRAPSDSLDTLPLPLMLVPKPYGVQLWFRVPVSIRGEHGQMAHDRLLFGPNRYS